MGHDLGAVFLPEARTASVVLMGMAQDHMGDRAGRDRLAEQAALLCRLGREAGVEDHVTVVRRDHVGVSDAPGLIHDVVEPADFDRDPDEVGGVASLCIFGEEGGGGIAGGLAHAQVDRASCVVG